MEIKAKIIASLAPGNVHVGTRDSIRGMPFIYWLSPISGGFRDDKVVRSSSIFWFLGGEGGAERGLQAAVRKMDPTGQEGIRRGDYFAETPNENHQARIYFSRLLYPSRTSESKQVITQRLEPLQACLRLALH